MQTTWWLMDTVSSDERSKDLHGICDVYIAESQFVFHKNDHSFLDP